MLIEKNKNSDVIVRVVELLGELSARSASGPCWLLAVPIKILLNCFVVNGRWKSSDHKDYFELSTLVLIVIEVISRNITDDYHCLHLSRSQASLSSLTSVCLLSFRCGSDLAPLP